MFVIRLSHVWTVLLVHIPTDDKIPLRCGRGRTVRAHFEALMANDHEWRMHGWPPLSQDPSRQSTMVAGDAVWNQNKLEWQPPTTMNCRKHGNMSGALRAPLGSFVSQLLAQWLAQECMIKFAQIFVVSSLPRMLMTPLAAKPWNIAKRTDFEPIWCIFPIKIFWITQTINFPMVSSACPAKVSS